MEAPTDVEIRIETQVRILADDAGGALSSALAVVRRAGGPLRGHLHYRLGGRLVALFLCENPTEAALALRRAGLAVETETAVVVSIDDRPGALAHLARTLEAEEIEVGYAYSTSAAGRLVAVLRTSDNPRAEDVLRKLLVLADAPDVDPASGDFGEAGSQARRS